MPFNLKITDCSPVLIDYDYEIVNKTYMAELVGELLLGHHFHVLKIIKTLTTTLPIHPDDSIEKVINKIRSASREKRDGWLFQMISWVVLAKRNSEMFFYSNYPHFAPAQHGIDGLAIILNNDKTLKNIVITEDKCTTSPRGKITQQVFPDFKLFEEGEKNNALVSIISSLLGELEGGRILEEVQNDIFQDSFKLYRIGITRDEVHNTVEGRKNLFLNYDEIISGATSRRSAATIYLEDLRNWMEDFSDKVIAFLESKKGQHV